MRARKPGITLLDNELFSEGCAVRVERAEKEPFDFSVWKVALRKQRKFHLYMDTRTRRSCRRRNRRG
jgi:hypothetical protein